MKLWIRSQDKETLRLAEMLDIYDLSDDEEQCWAIEDNKKSEFNLIMNPVKTEIQEFSTIVYEMPKE